MTLLHLTAAADSDQELIEPLRRLALAGMRPSPRIQACYCR